MDCGRRQNEGVTKQTSVGGGGRAIFVFNMRNNRRMERMDGCEC